MATSSRFFFPRTLRSAFQSIILIRLTFHGRVEIVTLVMVSLIRPSLLSRINITVKPSSLLFRSSLVRRFQVEITTKQRLVWLSHLMTITATSRELFFWFVWWSALGAISGQTLV